MASTLALLMRLDHTTTDSGICIDNIFIKTSSINAKTFKLMTLITDHYPLFIDIKKPLVNTDTEKKRILIIH